MNQARYILNLNCNIFGKLCKKKGKVEVKVTKINYEGCSTINFYDAFKKLKTFQLCDGEFLFKSRM